MESDPGCQQFCRPQWKPTLLLCCALLCRCCARVSSGGRKLPPRKTMMLTTDVALTRDPAYLEIVKEFAADITKLNTAFAHAWYKLVTRDMGPRSRCTNADAPPAQPFQNPLPPAPTALADFSKVRQAIVKLLRDRSSPLALSEAGAQEHFGALLVYLAWRCAATFRQTDFRGGCNGASIRLAPEKDWRVNVAMDQVLRILGHVRAQFATAAGALSWADLIVLAGNTALEEVGSPPMPFQGGRVDATDGSRSDDLEPREDLNPILEVKDTMDLMGVPCDRLCARARACVCVYVCVYVPCNSVYVCV